MNKPTIAELEKLLADPHVHVEIKPDGSVHAVENRWEKIDTAPRDGSRFLAWVVVTADEEGEDGHVIKRGVIEKYAVIGYFAFGSFVEFPWRGSFVQNMKWTHWMPLPCGPE